MRPEWCLDKSCEPDECSPAGGEGGSQFCCGRTTGVMVTERQGVIHENDGHFCSKTPRGIVMLEINRGDLELFARLCFRSLLKRCPARGFNPHWFTGKDSFGGE